MVLYIIPNIIGIVYDITTYNIYYKGNIKRGIE